MLLAGDCGKLTRGLIKAQKMVIDRFKLFLPDILRRLLFIGSVGFRLINEQ